MGEPQRPRSVAERLTDLIETVRKPGAGGKRYTDRDIGSAVGCSHTLIFNLRKGITDPAKVQSGILQRIATFFEVDPNYLQPEATAPALNPAAARIALRASQLSPAGLEMVQELLEHISKLESAQGKADEAAQLDP
ncbi:hypothetical protein [Allorhizocola rhizosphaerae]|uniref:hypothetical protein n=1 Tax=Allorhizocola rhizosphaerae TaxID=1872709 RepID=UPI000E3E0706|nr:hypothetical protein [Allorhizocola rhizosphaerae]